MPATSRIFFVWLQIGVPVGALWGVPIMVHQQQIRWRVDRQRKGFISYDGAGDDKE